MDNLATKSDLDDMLVDKATEPKALPLSLLEKITDGFSDMQQIGRGGFAAVYKGMLPNGAVAVKRLSNTYMYEKEFLGEIECLRKVKHKNIARFLGYCDYTQANTDIYNEKLDTVDTRQRILCFEYLPNGSLDCYIKGSFGGLEWTNRYKIIKGICEGLNYLHQQNIMHVDLKPTNIFLDENMIPKIADFGLSRRYREYQKPVLTTKMGENMEYMAPEFTGHVITHNFDFYNLGAIIIEILAGEMGQVIEKALQRLSNNSDISQWEQIQVCAEIAIECIDIDSAKRPVSIKHIIDKLLETESRQLFPVCRPRQLLLLHQFVLCFPFKPNKVIACPLQLTNITDQYVVFRLTDESENSFLNLPSYGIVPPRSSYNVDVTTQEQKELPQKSNTNLILDSCIVSSDDCIDKFQIQEDDVFEKANKTENMVQVTLKAFYIPRREMKYSSKMGSKPQHMSIQHTGTISHHATSKNMKRITYNFSTEKILGRGGFSVVYKGELQSGEVVAVKKLVRAMPSSQKQFENEINLLMKLHHQNIVRPVGYSYETQHLHKLHEGKIICARNTESSLCLEYLTNGSLDNHISGPSSGLCWHERWKIIEGISSGLYYLHEKSNPPIIHMDLKPSNILLDENMLPKIADFGLSILFEEEKPTSNVVTSGTLGYMPPEYLLQGLVTPKSDIFSLGVIIMEVITGHKDYPYDIITSSTGFIEHELQKWRNVLQKEQEYTSLEIYLQQINRCIEIGLTCVNLEQTKRPTIKKVLDMLLGLESTELNINNEGSQCDTNNCQDTNDKASHNTSKKKAAEDWMMEYVLVGRESEMNDLQKYTTKARVDSIQVMSVWGLAGVGKSALVKNLFCNIILNKQNPYKRMKPSPFSKYGWVDVSHPFNSRNFAWSLLLNLQSESLEAKETAYHDMMGSKNPILECESILKRHRCPVVIDGLKSTKEWDLIQPDLVSGSSKNCIIVITTEPSIAKHCHGNKGDLMFNVKGLEADSSFQLFQKEVSSKYPLPTSLSDGEVVELQELISKCGGLPKVIVEISRSLATKSDGRMDSARSLSNKFMYDLEMNREFHRLQGLFGWIHAKFHTCPDSLKPCIFYLSIFPRDRTIRRRRLVRRWIAEGYSRGNHDESVEYNGEKHFSDLLDLSIIQQPPTTLGDIRMASCQVNGFIHEYIVSRRMEKNLVFELGRSCTQITQRTARHLVILKCWDRDMNVFESIDFSWLRSFTVFGKWESFFISESMKLLWVLDLEDATGSVEYKDLERLVKWLPCLKFLSLRGRREIHHLPSSLGHLRQLQSLDVRHTSIVSLPENITKLENLQYMRAGTTDVPVSAPPQHIASSWFLKHHGLLGVKVPRGIGKLTNLHTLGVVNVAASGSKNFVRELRKLTQLRKLGVCGINKKNSKDFFSAIESHVHLESLSVRLNRNNNNGYFFKKDSNHGCLDDMISLPCKNLKSLKLHGLEGTLPKWGSNQLSNLAKLDLEMDTFTENVIKLLGKLTQLCILRVKQLQDGELCLRVRVNNEEEESYPKVKLLQIACGCSSSNLHVIFGSETMKKLELLRIDCSGGSSYQLTGLNYLSELKQILVKGTNDEEIKTGLKTQLLNHPYNPAVRLE